MHEDNGRPDQREDIVIGRNAVLELLKSGRPVECVYLQRGLVGTISKIAAIAKAGGITVKEVAAVKLDYLCAHGNHQGVAAQISGGDYAELADAFKKAEEAGEPVFLIIADGIEDPHNLGAVIRSAEAAGAHGLIIPRRRSAGLTPAAWKAAAGAAEYLPVIRVTNLVSVMEDLKARGCWIYAADMEGASWCGTDYAGPLALVIGSEGQGLGRLVKEKCDFTVSLPMRGKVNSLNVSVAAGIIMYEVARQRMGARALNK